MSKNSTRRDTCRLCGSRDRELVLPLKATPSGEDYVTAEQLSEPQELFPMDLFLCHSCGHAEFPDVIHPDKLYRNYKYRTSVSLGLVEHFGRYADAVLDAVRPASGSLVMDIGSNDGSLLSFFKSRGHRALGIDPAVSIAKQATEKGIETLPTYFTAERARELRKERGTAAVITANNVFANIDNLSDFATGLREMLAPDGVFIFETSYLYDVLPKMLLETFFHEHLSYFRVAPLQSYFQRHGMELFDIQLVQTKGGSIRGFVQLAGGRRQITPSVTKQIILEEEAGLGRVEPYKRFHEKVENVGAKLRRTIAEFKNGGNIVAGYGASVGVTTLLFQFELGGCLDLLVDDNPIRHNLFSPGQHLPVLPSDALYSRNASSVVVLAWAYFEAIKNRHQRFSARNGKFIVPLPDVRIV